MSTSGMYGIGSAGTLARIWYTKPQTVNDISTGDTTLFGFASDSGTGTPPSLNTWFFAYVDFDNEFGSNITINDTVGGYYTFAKAFGLFHVNTLQNASTVTSTGNVTEFPPGWVLIDIGYGDGGIPAAIVTGPAVMRVPWLADVDVDIDGGTVTVKRFLSKTFGYIPSNISAGNRWQSSVGDRYFQMGLGVPSASPGYTCVETHGDPLSDVGLKRFMSVIPAVEAHGTLGTTPLMYNGSQVMHIAFITLTPQEFVNSDSLGHVLSRNALLTRNYRTGYGANTVFLSYTRQRVAGDSGLTGGCTMTAGSFGSYPDSSSDTFFPIDKFYPTADNSGYWYRARGTTADGVPYISFITDTVPALTNGGQIIELTLPDDPSHLYFGKLRFLSTSVSGTCLNCSYDAYVNGGYDFTVGVAFDVGVLYPVVYGFTEGGSDYYWCMNLSNNYETEPIWFTPDNNPNIIIQD